MTDIREVAERARGKTDWTIREIRSAVPQMLPRLVEGALNARYGSSARSTVGPTGWHRVPSARATHWFLRGWAICGYGSVGTAFGRRDDENDVECPTCRREIERTKAS